MYRLSKYSVILTILDNSGNTHLFIAPDAKNIQEESVKKELMLNAIEILHNEGIDIGGTCKSLEEYSVEPHNGMYHLKHEGSIPITRNSFS